MKTFEAIQGNSPVVLTQPHGGTFVPDTVMSRLNPLGQGLSDTDWHISRLYDGLLDGVSVIKSNVHRYVIDANRDPGGVSLYPDQNTTTLCPLTDFDGTAIWQNGESPNSDEIEERRAAYHAPYHAAIAEEIDRVKALHGVAILYDCHSIRSQISYLFDGELPVFSIGTNDGKTCAVSVQNSVLAHCMTDPQFNSVLNGRFKGGWTTRNYGHPEANVHAIQMELAQRVYMEEVAPWTYCEDRAAKVRPVLARILNDLDHLARSGALSK
jgi:N-formylglutamate deformylase